MGTFVSCVSVVVGVGLMLFSASIALAGPPTPETACSASGIADVSQNNNCTLQCPGYCPPSRPTCIVHKYAVGDSTYWECRCKNKQGDLFYHYTNADGTDSMCKGARIERMTGPTGQFWFVTCSKNACPLPICDVEGTLLLYCDC